MKKNENMGPKEQKAKHISTLNLHFTLNFLSFII